MLRRVCTKLLEVETTPRLTRLSFMVLLGLFVDSFSLSFALKGHGGYGGEVNLHLVAETVL